MNVPKVIAITDSFNMSNEQLLIGGKEYELEVNSLGDVVVTYENGNTQTVGYLSGEDFVSTYIFPRIFKAVEQG